MGPQERYRPGKRRITSYYMTGTLVRLTWVIEAAFSLVDELRRVPVYRPVLPGRSPTPGQMVQQDPGPS
ncbi:hypothetical protein [Streptomyces decoyicus]|uniref:hypothetical protein n=1 Tax=Streptomyces decoyicus TaxID=249567 RepID=UPI00386E2C37